jgi:hypothetical protein
MCESENNAFDGLMLPSDGVGLQNMGMPRAMRPSSDKDGQTTGGSKWLLWFHGRESGFDPENQLPNLSTGRIYFAESEDGLRDWKFHEDSPCLNPSKEDGDWWYFDSEHVGLGDVVLPGMNAQSKFNTQDGVFLMYTFGGNSDQVSIPPKEGDDQSDDASESPQVLKGVRMEIGVCVSQDGAHWSRVEGPQAVGSILSAGSPDEFDAQFVGWPSVLEDGAIYKLYYNTYDPRTKRFVVGLATGKDALKYTKQGQVFAGGPVGAFDGMGASRRHVQIVKPGSAFARERGNYRMWYEAVSSDGVHSIGLATSKDGKVSLIFGFYCCLSLHIFHRFHLLRGLNNAL